MKEIDQVTELAAGILCARLAILSEFGGDRRTSRHDREFRRLGGLAASAW